MLFTMADIKEIARRTALALAAIKQAVGKAEFSVDLFVSHHIEELDATYWQQHCGAVHPCSEQVLAILELRSHWGQEGDGLDVFDFTLPGEVTDYVISVRFDDDGAVEDISMES
jgi:hypothetical protein